MTGAPSPLAPTGRYDLRSFFPRVGGPRGGRALNTAPIERPLADTPIELLDDARVRVTADPLPVAGFVDGIQGSLFIRHREHRPIYLNYTAAGAIGPGARLIGVKESLAIVCSTADREWVDAMNEERIPVRELAATLPPNMESDAIALLGQTREGLERALVDTLVESGDVPLILDGSLLARPNIRGLVGVVKTTRRQYLPDERVLWGMPAGWRSPRFKITARTPGASIGGVDRYSCYLRLFEARDAAWNYGLVRLEAFDPDLLEPLAARCLMERQGANSVDPRADRHLASVRACEDALRRRRPSVFG
jgi:hypothetical protein